MPTIDRAATISNHEGRTLEGHAFRFEHPSRVSDDGRTFYLEEFHRGSVTKSLTERQHFALGLMHPWSPGARTSPVPIGSVQFNRGKDALEFTAVISRTMAGDEALELVNDKALSDVSVSARVFKTGQRVSPLGPVVVRQEIGLRELSLVPPGMGQHQGAQILAVRSEAVGTPARDALRKRLVLLGLV